MAPVNFVFICQAVDEDDPILATTISWITAFANHPQVEHVTVLSLRSGQYQLPRNVNVTAIQGNNPFHTLFRFYHTVLTAIRRRRADFFFIYQGGPYPFLLLPVKIGLKKRVYQWKALPYISPQTRFYARYCDTAVFTSTPNAFPLSLPEKLKIVGQGIDTKHFRVMPEIPKTGDLVTVGRIAPVKKLEVILQVLALCAQRYGQTYRLDIYGPTSEQHAGYWNDLQTLVGTLNLSGQVALLGPVKHADLPAILNRYRALINCSETALDRAVIEAMACELPVLTTNLCAADILPQALKTRLFVAENHVAQIAHALHTLMSHSDEQLRKIGEDLRNVVVQEHSVERLIGKIMTEVQASSD